MPVSSYVRYAGNSNAYDGFDFDGMEDIYSDDLDEDTDYQWSFAINGGSSFYDVHALNPYAGDPQDEANREWDPMLSGIDLEAPVFYVDPLDAKLAAFPELHTAAPGRRTSRKRFVRSGQRYVARQDHGTAAGRNGIEKMRRHRATLHDRDLDPTIARQRRAVYRDRKAA